MGNHLTTPGDVAQHQQGLGPAASARSDSGAQEGADLGADVGADVGADESPWTPALSLAEAQQQLAGLLAGEADLVANAANMSAFLNTLLPSINWVGFYFLRGSELVLGPFQGRPACVRIAVGRGVCGHCIETGVTQRVDDVHAFPGHIACDIRSRSELVVPLRAGGELMGVLDIDSPLPERFSAGDQHYVEALVDVFTRAQFPAV